MYLHLKCKRKIADFAPYFPLIAMLVPQPRVSNRSVEQIAQFRVVSVISVDRGAHYDAMKQMASVAPHACASTNRQFLRFFDNSAPSAIALFPPSIGWAS